MVHEPKLVRFQISYIEGDEGKSSASKWEEEDFELYLSDNSAGAVDSWARATIDEHNWKNPTRKRYLNGVYLFGIFNPEDERKVGT
jgi:hypothetical protein